MHNKINAGGTQPKDQKEDAKVRNLNADNKTAKRPCRFWKSDQGCRRGRSFPYAHDWHGVQDITERCFNCGSKQRMATECTA